MGVASVVRHSDIPVTHTFAIYRDHISIMFDRLLHASATLLIATFI